MRRVVAAAILMFCLLVIGSPADSADIRLNDYKGGGWVEIKGDIVQGDTERLINALSSVEWNNTAIYLDSPGGNALEGIKMGLLARTSGFTTVVGNRMCASACALTWVGGVNRLMMPNARVGFHSTYTVDKAGKSARSEEGNAAVSSYAKMLGLARSATELMIKADPDEILWITPEVATETGMEYHQLDPITDNIPYSQR